MCISGWWQERRRLRAQRCATKAIYRRLTSQPSVRAPLRVTAHLTWMQIPAGHLRCSSPSPRGTFGREASEPCAQFGFLGRDRRPFETHRRAMQPDHRARSPF